MLSNNQMFNSNKKLYYEVHTFYYLPFQQIELVTQANLAVD